MHDWRDDLETVGAELFHRYRKRFLRPGILWEIRHDYPGLGWVDLWFRIHAARRLLHEGHDFAALQAIRSGHWRRRLAARQAAGTATERRLDPWSRRLVRLGGVLFLVFCLLLSSAAGLSPWLLLVGTFVLIHRRRPRPVVRPGWSGRSAPARG